MMKNKNTKKRLPEEKIVLNRELKNKLFFLVFILCSPLSAQINLNGFGKFEHFNTHKEYNSLSILNINPYDEILLFNDYSRSAIVQTNNSSYHIRLPYILNEIKKIKHDRNNSSMDQHPYAFISRASRKAGIIRKNNTSINVEHFINLNGYPSNLNTGDVDNDGYDELLISGSNFSGLSLIKYSNNKLSEFKFENKSVYTCSIFIDFDNDGLIDIAAYNFLTKKIDILKNSGELFFKKENELDLGIVNKMQSIDINADGLMDFIISEKNQIKIYYGDVNSTYKKNKVLEFENIQNFYVTNVNNDYLYDLVVLSNKTINIFYSFNKPEYNYPIKFSNNNIHALTIFKNRIAYLNSYNELFLLKDIKNENIFNLKLGSDVTDYAFTKSNTKSFLVFIDKINFNLNVLVFNEKKNPDKIILAGISKKHKNLLIKSSGNILYVYCFTPKEQFIEVLRINTNNNNYQKFNYYAEGKINNYGYVSKNGVLEPAFKFISDKHEEEGILIYKNSKIIFQSNINNMYIKLDNKSHFNSELSYFIIDKQAL